MPYCYGVTSRLVVLVSGAGTNLQALIDACRDPAYGATVVAVGADRAGIAALDRAERAGIPAFVLRLGDFPGRDDWDEALARACAGYQPDLVVCAGFMKLVGKPFLEAFGGRCLNTHPALLPSFPGTHGVRDALAYGVKVTGCTVFLVDEGVDAGPVLAQAAVPVRDDDDEATLHERIKVAERALLVDTVAGWPARAGPSDGRKVRIGPCRDTVTQIPIRRALISVYDKTGLEELARAARGRRRDRLHRQHRGRIAAAGVPVTQVEDLTGFPECLDGRVKTLHPRVHAGLLADTRNAEHVAQLDELGIEPFQLLVSNLYPFEETVASGAAPDECVEQIDIGGPAMVRAAAKNHASVAVVDRARPSTPTCWPRWPRAASPWTSAAGWPPRRSRTPPPTTSPWRPGSRPRTRPTRPRVQTGWPDVAGALWPRADVLRYGENPHQRAALYARPGAPAGIAAAELLHGKAMSYNNYVDADAARRAAYDFAEPCVAIIKHSNPCGIAVGTDLAEAHAKAHACDPVSRVRRGDRGQRPGDRGDGRADRGRVHRGGDRAGLRRRGAGHPVGAARTSGCCAAPAAPPRGSVVEMLRPVTGGMLMQTADRVDGRATTRRTGSSRPASPSTPGARGPRVRVEGVPFGQVQRDPAGRRRRLGRDRHGPGQPGRLGPAGGAAGR